MPQALQTHRMIKELEMPFNYFLIFFNVKEEGEKKHREAILKR